MPSEQSNFAASWRAYRLIAEVGTTEKEIPPTIKIDPQGNDSHLLLLAVSSNAGYIWSLFPDNFLLLASQRLNTNRCFLLLLFFSLPPPSQRLLLLLPARQTLSLVTTLCWVATCFLTPPLTEPSLFPLSLPPPPPPAPPPCSPPAWMRLRLPREFPVRAPPTLPLLPSPFAAAAAGAR